MLHTSGMDTNRPAKTPLQRDIDAAQEEKTMTTHPQHTPTPWHVHEIRSCPIRIHNAKDQLVTQVHNAAKRESGEMEANAAFIVEAVNAHEGLKKTNEELIQRLIMIGNNAEARMWNGESKGPDFDAFQEIKCIAREGIKQSEGK